MSRNWILGVSLSLLALAGTIAAADPKHDKARAKLLYDQGLAHYNVAEYAEAITSWKESYLLSKAPLLLFNLGQAYRLSGDCAKANTFYQSYRREEPQPPNRDELAQAIALCNQPVPPDKPIPPAPPSVVPGKPVETAPDPGRGRRTLGLLLGVGGVVLGGVGIVFAVGARSAANDLDHHVGEWGPDQIATEHRGKRDVKLAWTFGGVGLAAVGVGTVLYVMGRRSEQPPAVTLVPTATGAELAWTTAF